MARIRSGLPWLKEYSSTLASKCFTASKNAGGVGMSGWPMFRWYTFRPSFLAFWAMGTNLRMGDSCIS